ncbi:hypothetical protein [Amycolatopsis plumensis]|uniref:Uncharacterized protein n=1 Tax=Amycolatopsis plumensis TaxID=236508 RepID=A0ABV5UD11_9PSEU
MSGDHRLPRVAHRRRPAEYIDSTTLDPGQELTRLGGAAAIIATASSGASMSPLVAGLGTRGQLLVVGAAPDPIEIRTPDLIFGTHAVVGALTGSATENEDSVRLATTEESAAATRSCRCRRRRRPTNG